MSFGGSDTFCREIGWALSREHCFRLGSHHDACAGRGERSRLFRSCGELRSCGFIDLTASAGRGAEPKGRRCPFARHDLAAARTKSETVLNYDFRAGRVLAVRDVGAGHDFTRDRVQAKLRQCSRADPDRTIKPASAVCRLARAMSCPQHLVQRRFREGRWVGLFAGTGESAGAARREGPS